MKLSSVLLVIIISLGISENALSQDKNEAARIISSSVMKRSSSFSRSDEMSAMKVCFEGTVWVKLDFPQYGGWGGQQLDSNGKPIPCPKEEKKK